LKDVQPILIEIGKLLKEERESRELQQKDVALKIGLSRQHLSSIEYGKVETYSIRSLILLCDLYGINLSEVIETSENKLNKIERRNQ